MLQRPQKIHPTGGRRQQRRRATVNKPLCSSTRHTPPAPRTRWSIPCRMSSYLCTPRHILSSGNSNHHCRTVTLVLEKNPGKPVHTEWTPRIGWKDACSDWRTVSEGFGIEFILLDSDTSVSTTCWYHAYRHPAGSVVVKVCWEWWYLLQKMLSLKAKLVVRFTTVVVWEMEML